MQLWHLRGGLCLMRRLPVGSPPRAVVDFVGGSRDRPVLWSELRVDRNSKSEIQLPEKRTASGPALNGDVPDWMSARQAILALRLGQVTERVAKLVTVGTEEIETFFREIVERAESKQPAFMVVEGPWGTGKTHALALLRGIAVENKMAVAQVVLDGVASTLSRPNELLREIVRGVAFPSDNGQDDLLDLVISFARDQRTDILYQNGLTILAEALKAVPPEATNNPDAVELIESYLAGEVSANQIRKQLSQTYDRTSGFVSLKAVRRADQPERFATLLGEWALAARSLHSHGLVVILDEADVELAFAKSAQDQEQRNRLLEEIAALRAVAVPLAVVIAVAPGAEIAGFSSPTEYLSSQLGKDCRVAKVPELRPRNLVEVAEKIVRIYDEAYPQSSTILRSAWEPVAKALIESGKNSPGGIVPRRFIRSFIEHLDAEHFRKSA